MHGRQTNEGRVRILITGSNGQVGQALVGALSAQHELIPTTSADLNIASRAATGQIISLHPDIVLHPAAWTDVEGCARDPERAMLVNGLGTKHIALACQHLDIPLLYISTNEVFDGTSSTPYFETDTPNPINPYAHSKLAGEYYVQHLLERFYIVRVAWVFGGTRNFVRTVQRLAAERGSLRVVDDEIGNPTYAPDIATAVSRLISAPDYGIYHFVNEGHCSRYDLAVEVLRQSDLGHVPVTPIKLKDFQRASTPPAFTALRNFAGSVGLDIKLPPWQDAVERFVRDAITRA